MSIIQIKIKTMLKRFVQKSRYVTFALVIIFIGVEVYLRWEFSEHMIIKQYPKVYVSDTALGYRGIPGIKGHIRFPA